MTFQEHFKNNSQNIVFPEQFQNQKNSRTVQGIHGIQKRVATLTMIRLREGQHTKRFHQTTKEYSIFNNVISSVKINRKPVNVVQIGRNSCTPYFVNISIF